MDHSWIFMYYLLSIIFMCSGQVMYPDLKSLDLFNDHPMDIGALLPDTLLKDSSIPSSLVSNNSRTDPTYVSEAETKVVSISATQPQKDKAVFSMRNAEPVKTVIINSTPTDQPKIVTESVVNPTSPPTTENPTTTTTTTTTTPQTSVKSVVPLSSVTKADLKTSSKVVHEFLPQNFLTDTQENSKIIQDNLKDNFNIAGSSVLLSDVFNKPWNLNQLYGQSYILKNHVNKLEKKYLKQKKRPSKRLTPSVDHLTTLLKKENALLNIALGLVSKDKNKLVESLFKRKPKCPHKPYSLDKRYFMEKVKDAGWIRRRCALGTAYDQETCECSIFVGYQPESCVPEVHMDFNNGFIGDQSENKIPSGVEGVASLSDLAYFNGASRIVFWRYTNFDFQHSIALKFRFKSEANVRKMPHPLITNCGTGQDEPSFGVILNSFSDVLTFFVKTTKSDIKFLTFKINPMEWNDVIYMYDGEYLTGKVNDIQKRASVKGNVEIRSAELTIGNCQRYGWFKGFMDDVKIYSCVPKE